MLVGGSWEGGEGGGGMGTAETYLEVERNLRREDEVDVASEVVIGHVNDDHAFAHGQDLRRFMLEADRVEGGSAERTQPTMQA